MALGSAGGSGGSSSSSSNLSPLAPPFTVGRFNPKPNSNPHLNFTSMPYAVAPPFGHTWQYIQHSETRSDVFPKLELVVDDLTRTTGTPLANECLYSVPVSVGPSSTQWSGLDPGVSMPLSNDYRYSVPESVDPSSTQWSGPPFGQNWQYQQHLSEPTSDVFPKPKLDVGDSTRTTSMPLANDYHYSGSESVNPSGTQCSGRDLGVESSSNAFYVAEGKPYYPGYVSPVVCEDNPLVSVGESGSGPLSASGLGNISPQVDYTESLSGLEYMPQWGGICNGLAEAKQGKQVESWGSFSFEKVHDGAPFVNKNYMSQGPAVESGDISRGDSGFSYGKSTDGIRRESYTASSSVKNTNDKSFYAQELGSGMFYGNLVDGIGEESHNGSLSVGNANNELVYSQKLGFLPFESSGTQFLGLSSPISESQPSYPFQESSKNLFNYQKKYGPHEMSVQPHDPFMQDSASFVKPSRAVVIRAPVNGGSFPSRDPVTHETIGTGNARNVCMKLLDSPNPSKSKEPHVLSSPESIVGSLNTSKLDAGKELLSKTHNRDPIDITLKRKSVPHVSDTNVSPGLSLTLDHVQPFKYTENPSDSLDNPNPAVDSPCWKGAPASHYSPLDVVETSTPHCLPEKLEGSFDLEANGNHIVPSGRDLAAADCQKQFEENTHKKVACTGNDMASYPNSTSDSNCAAKESNLADGGISFNDALEGGAVAYHAAENVLCSPSAQENSVEQSQPSGRQATPKMDARTLINAMHNLSEILHFSCSADSCGLKEQDREVLKCVISNLDACMSDKIVNSTPAPEPVFSREGTSDKTEELHDLHVGKCTDKLQKRYQGTMKSYGQRDHQYMHTENINFIESGKKAEYIPYFLPLVDDVRISSDEDMVQAIKKVLDENFNLEEEMQSQLYKNLWLEAEAKLCSISYKARFDRLRILVDKDKSRKKEIAADMYKVPDSDNTPGLKGTFLPASLAEDGSAPEGTVANFSTVSTNSDADDVEASVLARFDILRCLDEKSSSKDQQQPGMVDNGKAGQIQSPVGGLDRERTMPNHSTFRNNHADDVEPSVLAKFNMLKCRDDKSKPEERQPMVDAMKADGLFQSSKGGLAPEGTITDHTTSRNNHAMYNMLRCGDDKLNLEEHQKNMIDTRKAEGLLESSAVGFGPEDTITNHSTFSKISHADDGEASVLARFNILKWRDEKSNTEEQLSNLVDARQPEGQYGSYIGVSRHNSIKEFSPGLANGPVLKANRAVSSGDEHPLRWFDNSSSDWEHVLKDDFTWQK